MRILVFIEGAYDVKVPMEFYSSTGRLKDERNVLMLNPADRTAIDQALDIRERAAEGTVVLAHLGPVEGEIFLREGLAAGCDEAYRIWNEEARDLQTRAKAVILSRLAQVLSFDLILAGVCRIDAGSGQLGVLVASMLDVPCIAAATALRVSEQDALIATKQLSDGSLQRVQCSTPAVITFQPGEELRPPASFAARLETTEQSVPCFDLADLGIPSALVRKANSLLAVGPLRDPVPKTKYLPAPDSSLPGYERRMQLLEGSVKKRQGRIVDGDEDEVVEELFRTLLKAGRLAGPVPKKPASE